MSWWFLVLSPRSSRVESVGGVVMSRLKSEMSGSSGLGQREDVDMVLRVQS
jgi:hypothetical protein